jgi:hypothetical protein
MFYRYQKVIYFFGKKGYETIDIVDICSVFGKNLFKILEKFKMIYLLRHYMYLGAKIKLIPDILF